MTYLNSVKYCHHSSVISPDLLIALFVVICTHQLCPCTLWLLAPSNKKSFLSTISLTYSGLFPWSHKRDYQGPLEGCLMLTRVNQTVANKLMRSSCTRQVQVPQQKHCQHLRFHCTDVRKGLLLFQTIRACFSHGCFSFFSPSHIRKNTHKNKQGIKLKLWELE